jgi:hypothetical protein|tara:strand:- start:68 stop:319 length:252 start_codon:yes stop_codon:yes gene_type:complete
MADPGRKARRIHNTRECQKPVERTALGSYYEPGIRGSLAADALHGEVQVGTSLDSSTRECVATFGSETLAPLRVGFVYLYIAI